jgi:hypothetical protein
MFVPGILGISLYAFTRKPNNSQPSIPWPIPRPAPHEQSPGDNEVKKFSWHGPFEHSPPLALAIMRQLLSAGHQAEQ